MNVWSEVKKKAKHKEESLILCHIRVTTGRGDTRLFLRDSTSHGPSFAPRASRHARHARTPQEGTSQTPPTRRGTHPTPTPCPPAPIPRQHTIHQRLRVFRPRRPHLSMAGRDSRRIANTRGIEKSVPREQSLHAPTPSPERHKGRWYKCKNIMLTKPNKSLQYFTTTKKVIKFKSIMRQTRSWKYKMVRTHHKYIPTLTTGKEEWREGGRGLNQL